MCFCSAFALLLILFINDLLTSCISDGFLVVQKKGNKLLVERMIYLFIFFLTTSLCSCYLVCGVVCHRADQLIRRRANGPRCCKLLAGQTCGCCFSEIRFLITDSPPPFLNWVKTSNSTLDNNYLSNNRQKNDFIPWNIPLKPASSADKV